MPIFPGNFYFFSVCFSQHNVKRHRGTCLPEQNTWQHKTLGRAVPRGGDSPAQGSDGNARLRECELAQGSAAASAASVPPCCALPFKRDESSFQENPTDVCWEQPGPLLGDTSCQHQAVWIVLLCAQFIAKL